MKPFVLQKRELFHREQWSKKIARKDDLFHSIFQTINTLFSGSQISAKRSPFPEPFREYFPRGKGWHRRSVRSLRLYIIVAEMVQGGSLWLPLTMFSDTLLCLASKFDCFVGRRAITGAWPYIKRLLSAKHIHLSSMLQRPPCLAHAASSVTVAMVFSIS